MLKADEAPADRAGASRLRNVRGAAGFFRVGQAERNRWWLVTPDDQRVFLRSVHGVVAPGAAVDGEPPADPSARLRAWGFNGIGLTRDARVREDGLPFLASADLVEAGAAIVGPQVRVPDVFDPLWPQQAAAHAQRVCRPLHATRELVGWASDDRLEWAAPSAAGRPSLLQVCLSLEPRFAAWHAAWEFVLAHHRGRLEEVAQAWNVALPNKEVVRELTRAEEGLGSRGYLRDDARWTREFARRYFAAASAAIRGADPNHLVFSCRFRREAGAAVLSQCVYPVIDVGLPHWMEIHVGSAGGRQPVVADNVRWQPEPPAPRSPAQRLPRLTSLERMLRKARATLDRLARHPAVIGYAWGQWQDDAAEQAPFAGGLVHVNGAEAREHTELLTRFNHCADALRESG